jgi:hypothetical protein
MTTTWKVLVGGARARSTASPASASALDGRWIKVRVQPVAVFPDGDATISEQMRASGNFMYFSEFLALVSEDQGRPTPKWMLDSLSRVPTWDRVQDAAGRLFQGILTTRAFELVIGNDTIEVPFSTILKPEGHAEGAGAPRRMRVTLRDNTVLEGVIRSGQVELVRKGHKRQFALQEMAVVCLAFQLLSAA